MRGHHKIGLSRHSRWRAFAAFAVLYLASAAALAPPQPRASQHRQPHRPASRSSHHASVPAPPSRSLEVTYKNGLLSISAQNAPLLDLLEKIHEQTGATIIAPGSLEDTVTMRLDPASPAQILVALLHGSRFDYVIAGSPSDSMTVATVIVSVRSVQIETVVAARQAMPEASPVEPRAQTVANLTGGDEGSVEVVEVGTPVVAAPAVAPSTSLLPK